MMSIALNCLIAVTRGSLEPYCTMCRVERGSTVVERNSGEVRCIRLLFAVCGRFNTIRACFNIPSQ